MIKKVYKKIEQENGTITFYGANRAAKLHYGFNKDIGQEDEYFYHYGRKYWLSEIPAIGTMWTPRSSLPDYMQEFDGYMNDTFFSGIAIKFVQGDYEETMVKAFTFIS